MPTPLESIVQRMIDAGEPEENIAQVIRSYQPPAPQPPSTFRNDPTSFAGGVMKSLTSGEALGAGLKGGLGWLKGATIDLPSTIGGALSDIGQSISSPIETAKGGWGAITNPSETLSGMWNPIAETTARSGSDPEAFGRMMGVATGQPLTTYGLAKAAPIVGPPTARGVGGAMAGAGRIMTKHQPVSGMIPRIAEMRTLRNIEKAAGKGLTNVGERVKSWGTPVVDAQPLEWAGPPWKEGEIIPEPPAQLGAAPSTALPASETDFFAGPGYTNRGRQLTPEVPMEGQAPGRPIGYDVPMVEPEPVYTPPPPPTPKLLPSRGEQFNLPEVSATSVPGQFTDVTTGRILTPDELVQRMARPAPAPTTPAPVPTSKPNLNVATQTMTPDDFLQQADDIMRRILPKWGTQPIKREVVEMYKKKIAAGEEIKPLMLDERGLSEGRHRAIAYKELGINEVPVQRISGATVQPTLLNNPPASTTINASGESAASAEAISRQAGMKAAKKQFVVYDKAGNKRPLIGPDAVDYKVRPGETFGIEGPEGFQVLDDMGGSPPKTRTAHTAEGMRVKDKLKPNAVYRVMKDKMTPEFLEKSKKNGFQLVGQTPQGDFLFKKIR